jgi:hypothetical protein
MHQVFSLAKGLKNLSGNNSGKKISNINQKDIGSYMPHIALSV